MLDATPQETPDANVEQPKDNTTRIASPPPAYAPPPPPPNTTSVSLSLPEITAMRIRRAEAEATYRNSTCTSSSPVVGRPLTTTNLSVHTNGVDTYEEDYMAGGEEGQSPICLRINTSVSITKSNNIVCLADTPPAEHATAIANAVVKAMQENSSGNCGIPMIDEDGRPRPIKIEVDASMLVEGSGNIVGSSPIISEFLRQRGLRRSRQPSQEIEEQGESSSSSKRRRTSPVE